MPGAEKVELPVMPPATNEKKKSSLAWWLAGALIVGLFAAARWLPVARWLDEFDQRIAGLGAWGFVLFVTIYAVGTVLLVPGSALTVGAGLVFGLGWGVAAVTLGANLGAAGAFLLARHVARKKVASMALTNPKFKALDAAVARQGWKVVLLLRLSPLIPFNLINYLYGLTPVRFWTYAANSFVGMLPGTVLYVYLGAAGRAGLHLAGTPNAPATRLKTVLFILGLAATFAVTWLLGREAKRILAEQTPEAKATPPA